MGMTPVEFLESFVEGNLIDCEEHPWCVRRAFNAAVAASHLADHYFNYNARHNPSQVSRFIKFGDYIEHLCRETNGAFRDIRSIANAYKHLYTGDKYSAHSSVSSGGAISSIIFDASFSDLKAIEDEYEPESNMSEGRSFVLFTRKDGSKAEFLPLLQNVVQYWCDVLYDA
jgi:hypothetical protein